MTKRTAMKALKELQEEYPNGEWIICELDGMGNYAIRNRTIHIDYDNGYTIYWRGNSTRMKARCPVEAVRAFIEDRVMSLKLAGLL